ncbi:hypothetical protein [Hoeflea poritis]|uniref:PNPLA domain-containing protein n=1 Tax=Hoeflea poritis TaxID=2993659 RepID=A0ABT4VV81_9HYPH|nr:hypothetical protein [Hoeflea poritis]MDA4848627.1 hypothetical protein [Hoeflea poritis]
MRNSLPRRLTSALIVFLAATALSACTIHSRVEDTTTSFFVAQYWKTPLSGLDYPEMADNAISKHRQSFGVAFQGGGNRAAPAALGQLRALHDLGWIDKVRYISAISGGSWTAIPYTFLKNCPAESDVHCDQSTFLGVSKSPEEVALRLPGIVTEKNPVEFAPGSMLGAIADGAVTGKVINAWTQGRFDESFSNALGEIYLRPFGLSRSKRNDPDSLFTWRKTDRDRIRRENRGNERIARSTIHYVERKRPYLIVGGVVLTRRTLVEPDGKFRMEMTPLYTGIPRKIDYETRNGTKFEFGGGFVESFGYDYVTEDPGLAGPMRTLKLRDPLWGNRSDQDRLNFSLANMAAVSGAAPVETAVSIRALRFLAANFGFPEHFVPGDRRSPRQSFVSAPAGEIYEKEWAHGDGGHEDNLGLAPLLARQVENILVLANSVYPLNAQMIEDCKAALDRLRPEPQDPEKLDSGMQNCIRMIGGDIPSFFVRTRNHIHNVGLKLADSPTPAGRNELDGYYHLLHVAQELRDNNRLSCNRYVYDPGDAGAVGRSYAPRICILYLGLDGEWAERVRTAARNAGMSKRDIRAIRNALDLDEDLRPVDKKRRGVGSNGFPHLGTFFDQPGFLIKTDPARLYALYNYTAWALKKHSGNIKNAFANNGLDWSR